MTPDMQEFQDPIVERVQSVVSQHLRNVRKSGPSNIVSLCPFHSDRSPSFSMNLYNGLYICFSCGEQGNLRTFLNKVGYTKEEINRKYGRTLEQISKNAPPPPDPTKPEVVMEANRHVPEELLGIFHRCPEALIKEGFEEKTLLEFDIGVDLVHERITFPLRDLKGNLVGVSGRALRKGAKPRYKVYDKEYLHWELPTYHTDKALLLWNAHRVAPLMRSSSAPVIVVEGFKACMWVAQAGFPNVVALMTKSMSWTQRWILQRMGGNYIFWLDNDEAGRSGVAKICETLQHETPNMRIVEYDAPQPTDVPQTDVKRLIEQAPSYHQLLLG